MNSTIALVKVSERNLAKMVRKLQRERGCGRGRGCVDCRADARAQMIEDNFRHLGERLSRLT